MSDYHKPETTPPTPIETSEETASKVTPIKQKRKSKLVETGTVDKPEPNNTEKGGDTSIPDAVRAAISPQPDHPGTNGNGSALLDPFSPDALALPQDYSTTRTRKVLTGIKVGRPNRQLYIRVHPTLKLETFVLEVAETGETYLVAGHIRDLIADEIVAKVLRLYITRSGALGFWPIRLPDRDGRHNLWSSSAMEAAKAAETEWVCVKSNREAGQYDALAAEGEIAEPRWHEVLQGKSLQELLHIAFKGHLIDSPDHPVIKHLSGSI